jgi:hypothetical protein
MPLDDTLLRQYIRTFYGYGSYSGSWWLVGMEEGGGNSSHEIEARLSLWDARGRQELEDVSIFATSPSLGRWFTAHPPLQPTWQGLIRLILACEGRSTDSEAARSYQSNALGRQDGDNCLLELLPLPSPSVGQWIYGAHSSLPELQDRATYLRTVSPARIRHFQDRISQHQPKAVVFYSRNYQHWWEQVVGAPFGPPIPPGVQLVRGDHTLFVLTTHPTYRGVTTEYFVQVGRTRTAGRGATTPRD